MDISDKSRKSMENLGLTSYEIKVYLSLLEHGSMTASDISKTSGVPYSKIYEVLNSLENKVWLESASERPQKFFPKSPTTALEAIRLQKENELKSNEEIIKNELMPIYEKSGIKEKPEIWVVRGLYNIADKVSEIIQNSQRELLIALPQIAQEIAKSLQPMLRTLHDKGIRIVVLVSEGTSIEIIKAISRIADVRIKDNMFGGGVIGDGIQVLILLGEEGNRNGSSEPIAIWAEHPGLAVYAKDYFNYLWNDARNNQ
jgi:sugar-specific transcriptional regulator TrmB